MLRLGVIHYLNTLPVYYGILSHRVPSHCTLVRGIPTELNTQIHQGFLDISVISSFEYVSHPEKYYLFPDLSVSADGTVGSIFLFSNQPQERLTSTVLLTKASYTSNHLIQYLLRKQAVSYQQDSWVQDYAAKLLIGDDAIQAFYQNRFPYVYDLAEWWKQETLLPFVFAVWVVRREVYEKSPQEVLQVYDTLIESKGLAKDYYPSMASEYNHGIFPSEELCARYLRNLRYDFSTVYQEGLHLFQEHCCRMGFLTQTANLCFLP